MGTDVCVVKGEVRASMDRMGIYGEGMVGGGVKGCQVQHAVFVFAHDCDVCAKKVPLLLHLRTQEWFLEVVELLHRI